MLGMLSASTRLSGASSAPGLAKSLSATVAAAPVPCLVLALLPRQLDALAGSLS